MWPWAVVQAVAYNGFDFRREIWAGDWLGIVIGAGDNRKNDDSPQRKIVQWKEIFQELNFWR